MKKKKNKRLLNQPLKITTADYIKAVKKADREIQISDQSGFQSTTKVHKNKKTYNRNNFKKCSDTDE